MPEMQHPSNVAETPSVDLIKSSLTAIREQLRIAATELARQQAKIASLKEEEKLWERLLALRQGLAEPEIRSDEAPHAAGEGVGKAAMKAVYDELDKTQRPLHISEIMRLLASRGVELPGAGEQANLISHLRRDDRFVRTSRGMYALAAWGLTNEQPPPVRARRQRVRSGSKRQGVP